MSKDYGLYRWPMAWHLPARPRDPLLRAGHALVCCHCIKGDTARAYSKKATKRTRNMLSTPKTPENDMSTRKSADKW